MHHRLTIRQAARLLDDGAISSVDLASFCRSWAEAGEEIWGLNAFETFVASDEILDRAKASDDRRRLNERLSIFDGIPISVKANIAVSSQPLTAGSRILGMGHVSARVPAAGYDADVVRRLAVDSGSLVLGTTSMDEFGMGSLGNTSKDIEGRLRVTKNPLPLLLKLSRLTRPVDVGSTHEDWIAAIRQSKDEIFDLHQRAKVMEVEGELVSAGGSSCGSAVSVAHGSSLLSLGTDTGGSVRLPSAWCGLVGLKPTYGLLSRHGVVSYASSFDTVGILANSVDCATLALDILAQRTGTSRDSTFSNLPCDQIIETFRSSHDQPLLGIRVGIPAAFSVEDIPHPIRHAWSRSAEALHQKGAEVQEISTSVISPELVQRALAAYYVLVSAEASSNLSRYDGFRYGVAAASSSNVVPGLTPLEQQFSTTRTLGFGVEVARRILCGTSVLSSDRFHTHYEAAAKLRSVLALQLHTTLSEQVDAILIPTAISLPPRLDKGEKMDKTAMFANDIMTIPPSLAGLPVLSIPVNMRENEGIYKAGMSIVGPRLKEMSILKIGQILESVQVP